VLLPRANKYPHAAREFLMGTAFRLETAAQYYDSLLSTMRRGQTASTSASAPGMPGIRS
jgi:hypothetical protein